MKKGPLKRPLLITVLALAFIMTFSIFAFADSGSSGEGGISVVGTGWAVLPPLIAIVLAFVTKEVYSSLFAGCFVGAVLVAKFSPWATFETLFSTLMDNLDLKIIFFDVMLGIIVILFSRSGGSKAYGDWSSKWIRSRRSALVMTSVLGCVIFLDDYFNCLTVGTIMMPITDRFKVSRAKLSYIIDSTASPVCILAPISSWAAAVASYIPDAYAGTVNGFTIFVQAIPYNFYAILTLVMVFGTSIIGADFGEMRVHELNAAKGDLFTTGNEYPEMSDQNQEKKAGNKKGTVADLLIPTVFLIAAVIVGMVIIGRQNCIDSGVAMTAKNIFANTDSSFGLMFGCFLTIVLMAIMYIPRKILDFKGFMDCVVEGFKLMIPALLVLTFAWGLKGFVDQLDLADFVRGIFSGSETLNTFFPLIMFVVAGMLAFATGTSWGTMGILIPVVVPIFTYDGSMNSILVIVISAICAGAVFGDNCSPISDTTIMSSLGAQCNHMNHVRTQLQYALTVCADCVVCYILAGLIRSPWIPLIVGIALVIAEIYVLSKLPSKESATKAKA